MTPRFREYTLKSLNDYLEGFISYLMFLYLLDTTMSLRGLREYMLNDYFWPSHWNFGLDVDYIVPLQKYGFREYMFNASLWHAYISQLMFLYLLGRRWEGHPNLRALKQAQAGILMCQCQASSKRSQAQKMESLQNQGKYVFNYYLWLQVCHAHIYISELMLLYLVIAWAWYPKQAMPRRV